MQGQPQGQPKELEAATHTTFPVGEEPVKAVQPTNTAPTQNHGLFLRSPAFKTGESIDPLFTCEGQNISPSLEWTDPPEGTKSLVLIMDDVDAPGGVFVHWVLFNVPADHREIPQAVPRDETVEGIGMQGNNDAGKVGYFGPCPPPAKPHRYYFKLYALDSLLLVNGGATKTEVEQAMQGHIINQTQLMGTFAR